MGNNVCGLNETKETFVHESKVLILKTYNGVRLTVIQGDILEEQTDIIGTSHLNKIKVNSSYDPGDTIISKRERSNKMKIKLSQMKVGDLLPVETDSNAINSNHIYHVKLPSFQKNADLLQIYNSYLLCLERATSQKSKTILFTDLSTPNFSIPTQYNAEVMYRAFIKFLNDNKTTLQEIKFVSLDQKALKIFNYEMEKQFDELQIPELCQERNKKFFQFINSMVSEDMLQSQAIESSYVNPNQPMSDIRDNPHQSRQLTSDSEDLFLRKNDSKGLG